MAPPPLKTRKTTMLWEWSAEELEANRGGKLAATQAGRLLRWERQRALGMVGIAAGLGVLLGVAFALLGQTGHPRAMLVTVPPLIIAIAAPLIWWSGRGLRKSVTHGGCERIAGPMYEQTRRVEKAEQKYWTIGGEEVTPMFAGVSRFHNKQVTAFLLPHTDRMFAVDLAECGEIKDPQEGDDG